MAKKDKYCISLHHSHLVTIAIGGFIIMISLFLPRWRTDIQGTSRLQENWIKRYVKGSWTERHYGLIQVVDDNYRQSWSTLAQTTCEYRTYSGVATAFGAGWQLIKNGGKNCEGDHCVGEFFGQMQLRCEEYEKMHRVSSYTLALSIMSVFGILGGMLITVLVERRAYGGIGFMLFLFSGVACLVMNMAWAITTDVGFKRLGSVAWYPYPSLAIGWFFHLYGCLTLLIGTAQYGWVVLPETMAYDAVEEKINKHNRNILKWKRKQKQLEAAKAHNPQATPQMLMQQQQMPMNGMQQPMPQMMQPQMMQVQQPMPQMQVQMPQPMQMQQPMPQMQMQMHQQVAMQQKIQPQMQLQVQQVHLQMPAGGPSPQAFGSPVGGFEDRQHYEMPHLQQSPSPRHF